MTDLTKIKTPFGLCTKEEQAGLKALLSTPRALQYLGVGGKWDRLLCWDTDLTMHLTYRQNPDWQQPKLDVPDWFWNNSTADWVAMGMNGYFYGYEVAPRKGKGGWLVSPNTRISTLTLFTSKHNFNPHNVPWDKSLTKRPGLIE